MRRSKTNGVTSLFARVTKICGTSVARFFKNGGTGGKNRHNSNKNGELRVPLGVWDSGGTPWDTKTLEIGARASCPQVLNLRLCERRARCPRSQLCFLGEFFCRFLGQDLA